MIAEDLDPLEPRLGQLFLERLGGQPRVERSASDELPLGGGLVRIDECVRPGGLNDRGGPVELDELDDESLVGVVEDPQYDDDVPVCGCGRSSAVATPGGPAADERG